jgi:hypothetical protein
MLTLTGVAVTGNRTTRFGGGIFNGFATLTLEAGSTVSGNTPDTCEPDTGTCT